MKTAETEYFLTASTAYNKRTFPTLAADQSQLSKQRRKPRTRPD